MVDIIIRELVSSDYKNLGAFFVENCSDDEINQFNPFPLTIETAEYLLTNIHQDHYYGIVWGEKIVGFSMLRGWDEGYLIPSLGILIDAHHRGEGLGKILMNFTIRQAELSGCPSIRLSVYSSNIAAIKLYKALGFIEAERLTPDNVGEVGEKIIMLKNLREEKLING